PRFQAPAISVCWRNGRERISTARRASSPTAPSADAMPRDVARAVHLDRERPLTPSAALPNRHCPAGSISPPSSAECSAVLCRWTLQSLSSPCVLLLPSEHRRFLSSTTRLRQDDPECPCTRMFP